MPRLTPTHINTTRTLVVWCIRSVAVVLLVVGGYRLLWVLSMALFNGAHGFSLLIRIYSPTDSLSLFTYRGLAMLAVGLVLAFGARRIARWVITMPATGCPRCGYDGAVNDICPECGLHGVEGAQSQTSLGVAAQEP